MAFIALAAPEAVAVTTARNCMQKKSLAKIVQPLQKHLVKLNKSRRDFARAEAANLFIPKSGLLAKSWRHLAVCWYTTAAAVRLAPRLPTETPLHIFNGRGSSPAISS